jgi:drug/metabolite transporter (DMT)-like permease
MDMLKAVIVMFIGTVIVSVGDGLLSKGLRALQELERSGPFWSTCLQYIGLAARDPIIVIGVICHAAFFALLLVAFSLGDLSLVLPITSLTYVFAAIIAKMYLNEDVNALRWIGSIIIVLGVFVVLLGEGGKGPSHENNNKVKTALHLGRQNY